MDDFLQASILSYSNILDDSKPKKPLLPVGRLIQHKLGLPQEVILNMLVDLEVCMRLEDFERDPIHWEDTSHVIQYKHLLAEDTARKARSKYTRIFSHAI